MKKAIVIIGHGSRNAESNRQFKQIVLDYQESRPEHNIYHCFLELAAPLMKEVLIQAATECDDITVLPLQLFLASHGKNDIPLCVKEVQAQFPDKSFVIADVLGIHPKMAELAFARACETDMLPSDKPEDIAVIMVGRGSSDPGANSDFYKMVKLFQEGRGFKWVIPAFIALTDPSFDDALDLISKSRPKKLLIVPYFLLPGILIDRINSKVETFKEDYPWIQTQASTPLRQHEILFEILDERVVQATSGSDPLPCGTCKYRVELPNQEHNLGGLDALLYSKRHQFVHENENLEDNAHTHKPIKKHVLVCGNADCADNGSIRTLNALRARIKELGKRKEIVITQTMCMGNCADGPSVAVYPDGVWYKEVKDKDVDELVTEHLIGGSPVTRLIDSIM